MLLNLFLLVFLNIVAPVTSNRISYSIKENSSLTLMGSSNVNNFQCTTSENLSNGYIYIITEDEKDYVRFTNAILKINVKSFDCANPLLNKDFYKTLNANESPTIDVELLSATPLNNSKILKSGNGRFMADVAITLNGNSKADQLIIHWEKVSGNVYRFIGDKKLKMSDFDIETPVAALGLIKVRDEITIHFDLFIQANPKLM